MRRISLVPLFIGMMILVSCENKDGIPEARMESGEKLYKTYCQSCHMEDGGGVSGMNAPLIGSKYVSGDKEKLISIVLHGSAAFEGDEERLYKNLMPAIPGLTNSEIADVLTYVRNSFDNKAPEITPGDVEKAKTK